MKRSAFVVLLAGIAGVLIFLATEKQKSPGSVPAPETKAEVVETRGEIEARAPAADRTALPEETHAGWRVRVLAGRTDMPVPEATVSVIDLPGVSNALAARGVGFDTLEGLRLRREKSVEARTGADGCAEFANVPARSMVEARAGLEWAYTLVNELPPDRCVTLRLAPDRELRVRVVDSAGNPVGGVPVALCRQVDARPSFSWKWTDTQAGSGLATFLHFQRRLEQGTGWHALLAFPVPGQVVLPVDADTPLEPPSTLVLPETGRVRFRVRGTDGRLPDLEGIELHLEAFERGARLWPDGPWARPQLDALGEALAPWLGLGLEIRAALVQEGEELAARSIAGPARPGEELLCDLVLPRPGLTYVTGRFVLRDGRAWPAATVQVFSVLFPTPTRSPALRELAVASDGRFRMPIREARPANGTRSMRFSARHPDGSGEVLAVVPLDQDVPPEGLELGDVLLDYGELLASGRVVDAARGPVRGAELALHTHTLVSGEEYWPRILVAGSTRTAADGEFSLYLPPGEPQTSEELRLSTRAAGFVGRDDREVRRGQRNVEVVLERSGALTGSLELDRGLQQADVALFLSSDTKRFVPLRSDASFEELELPPGTYSLEVRRRGLNGRFEGESAARVDGLLVVAGETCRDPRIQKLHIASITASLRIRVVDRASTPVRGAAITIIGFAGARAALSGDDGLCLVPYAALPVDLEISAFGYLRQRVANVSTDCRVVLEAGIPIRLRTSSKPSGGEPRYLLGAMLFSVDASGVRRGLAWGAEFTSSFSTERSNFDPGGELALRMPAPGVYECDVQVTVLSGGVGRGGRVGLSPLPRFTVLASETEQLFELAIPQDAVDTAVAEALK